MRALSDILKGWNLLDALNTGRQLGLASGDVYGAFFFHVRAALEKFFRRITVMDVSFHICQYDLASQEFSPLLGRALRDSDSKFDRILVGVLLRSLLSHTAPYNKLALVCYLCWGEIRHVWHMWTRQPSKGARTGGTLSDPGNPLGLTISSGRPCVRKPLGGRGPQQANSITEHISTRKSPQRR